MIKLRKTLEQIIAKEKENRHEDGMFGINACKDHIKWWSKQYNESLYVLLEEYVRRSNEDSFFNRAMVLACWELINEQ